MGAVDQHEQPARLGGEEIIPGGQAQSEIIPAPRIVIVVCHRPTLQERGCGFMDV